MNKGYTDKDGMTYTLPTPLCSKLRKILDMLPEPLRTDMETEYKIKREGTDD